MAKVNVTMGGKPVVLSGHQVEVGEQAPDFKAIGNDMSNVGLADLKGGVLVLASVLSMDTSVCDAEARRFSEELRKVGGDVKFVIVSMDLPFTQKRWCLSADADNVVTVSDHRDASFGKAYGVFVEDKRILARTVFVVNRDRKVVYKQVVPEIGTEPDYAPVLKAVKEAL